MIRKTIPSIIAVFLLCLAFASYAHCALVGKVSLSEGRVDVLKAGRSNLTPVKTGDPVDVGDVYRVKSDGRAEIKFLDGGMIRIAPSSRVQIQDYSSDARKTNNIIRLSTGHVQVISGKSFVQKVSQFVEGNRFEVHTPNAVAGIRGSNMIVSFARSVTSTMFVDGKGYQYNPAAPTQTQVNIVKGQISFVAGNAPPTPPRKATPAEAASIIKTVTVTPKSSSGTGTTTSSTSENKSTASSGSGSTNNKGSSGSDGTGTSGSGEGSGGTSGGETTAGSGSSDGNTSSGTTSASTGSNGSSGSTSTASSGSGNSSGSTGSSGSAGANTMTSSGSIGSTNTGTTFITSAMATTTPAGMSQTTTPAVMQNTLADTTVNTLPDIPVTQTTGTTTNTATTPETPLTVNLTSTPPALSLIHI